MTDLTKPACLGKPADDSAHYWSAPVVTHTITTDDGGVVDFELVTMCQHCRLTAVPR